MSLLTRLLPTLLSGLNAGPGLWALLPFGRKKPRPERSKPVPDGKMRIHFFAGGFGTEDLAKRYCFHSEANKPEELTRELPDAFIDMTHVEVVFGNHTARLDEFLDPLPLAAILRKAGGKNTIVIIAEPAFGGFPYALNDTSMLTYLGAEIVDV